MIACVHAITRILVCAQNSKIELASGLRHDFINGSVVNASLATRPCLSAVSHQAPGEVHQRSPSNSLSEDSPASLATTNSGPRLSQGKNCAATPVRQWLSDCNGSNAASTLEKSAHNFDFAKCQVNSFNVRGWSCNQQEKRDFIANYLLKQEYPTIICVQETWETQNTEIEIDGCYLIGSGTETNSRSHGGISIALCPKATKAWKKAGKRPIEISSCSGSDKNNSPGTTFQ